MIDKRGRVYKLVPPEGGWGYIVTSAVSLFFIATIVPICVFGLVFGNFLAETGDETYGITLANGVFNTVLSFTGLPANHFLQKYSCRKVGILGALLFFLGAFGTVFVKTLSQFLITFGVFQGLGFGFMMPAAFTSFTHYFDERRTLMNGLLQAVVVVVTMLWPFVTKILLDLYGWRGTQLIVAGISLHCFLAMVSLQPIKHHLKRKYIDTQNGIGISLETPIGEGAQPLLSKDERKEVKSRAVSIVSVGSMAASVSNIPKIVDEPKSQNLWDKIYEAFDLSLFKSASYVNMALGLSLAFTSDLNFLSLLPMILKNAMYTEEQTTLVLTIFFGCDLACRILITIASGLTSINNRYVFLAGALLAAIFRTAFVMNDAFWWACVTCACLGFLRCLIQTPLPLVVAEKYGERFSTAFTLYMVVCGVIALIFGPLTGYVKQVTQSDKMVVHLLTAAYLGCGIPWLIEIYFEKKKKSVLPVKK